MNMNIECIQYGKRKVYSAKLDKKEAMVSNLGT